MPIGRSVGSLLGLSQFPNGAGGYTPMPRSEHLFFLREKVPFALLSAIADFGLANSVAMGEREWTIALLNQLGTL